MRPMAAMGARASTAFNLTDLFANGEPGVFFNPTPETTYQDAGGTIVAAVDSPIGLLMDVSRGLKRGLDLVSNGNFSAGTTDWRAVGTALSVDSGVCTVTNNNTYQGRIVTGSAYVQPNLYYEVAFEIIAVSASNSVYVRIGGDVNANNNPTSGQLNGTRVDGFGVGSHKVIGVAGAGSTSSGHVGFYNTVSGGTASFQIDNISIRQLPGNHLVQPTAGARPRLKQDVNGRYYLKPDNVDDFLSHFATPFNLTQGYTFVWIGKRYGYTTSTYPPLLSYRRDSNHRTHIDNSHSGRSSLRLFNTIAGVTTKAATAKSDVMTGGVMTVQALLVQGTGALYQTREDGVVYGVASNTDGIVAEISGLSLFRGWSGRYGNQDLYELLFIDRVLNDQEIKSVERDFALRAGLAI
jgi:hypothetical protein